MIFRQNENNDVCVICEWHEINKINSNYGKTNASVVSMSICRLQ